MGWSSKYFKHLTHSPSLKPSPPSTHVAMEKILKNVTTKTNFPEHCLEWNFGFLMFQKLKWLDNKLTWSSSFKILEITGHVWNTVSLGFKHALYLNLLVSIYLQSLPFMGSSQLRVWGSMRNAWMKDKFAKFKTVGHSVWLIWLMILLPWFMIIHY